MPPTVSRASPSDTSSGLASSDQRERDAWLPLPHSSKPTQTITPTQTHSHTPDTNTHTETHARSLSCRHFSVAAAAAVASDKAHQQHDTRSPTGLPVARDLHSKTNLFPSFDRDTRITQHTRADNHTHTLLTQSCTRTQTHRHNLKESMTPSRSERQKTRKKSTKTKPQTLSPRKSADRQAVTRLSAASDREKPDLPSLTRSFAPALAFASSLAMRCRRRCERHECE